MKETLGKVIKITSKGIDSSTIVEVEYQVNNENYIIKESLKLKSETIKIGIIPIGQRKKPKVNCKVGDTITIEYDENNPDKGHIKGNDGMMNC